MLRSEYQGINDMEWVSGNIPAFLEVASIWTYERMGIQADGRSTETILFDQDVVKYVRVTIITIFDQVYITDHNFITTFRIGVDYWHSYHSGQGQYLVNTNVVTGSGSSKHTNGMYATCDSCIVDSNALKNNLGKRVRVTDLGSVPLYYIYYTLRFIGSHSLPFGVCALMIYDTCVCTAPVPSVLPLGSSAL